jgi:hypothetical protein
MRDRVLSDPRSNLGEHTSMASVWSVENKPGIASIRANSKFRVADGIIFSPLESSNCESLYLVQLPNGKQFQCSQAIFDLLACMSSQATIEEISNRFTINTKQILSIEETKEIVDQVLVPKQLAIRVDLNVNHNRVDHDAAEAQKPHGFASHGRIIIPSSKLRHIAQTFSFCFVPRYAIFCIATIFVTHLVTYTILGFPPSVKQVTSTTPFTLGIVFASVVIHELGHAAACAAVKSHVSGLGIARYFLMPVLYTDVSKTWKNARRERVIVDLGGIYFQQIFTSIPVLAFAITKDISFLWSVIIIDGIVFWNLMPFLKLDGYWLLSDVTGIPNLHKRAIETFKLFLRSKTGDDLSSNANRFTNFSFAANLILMGYIGVCVVVIPAIVIYQFSLIAFLLSQYPELMRDVLFIVSDPWLLMNSQALQAYLIPLLFIHWVVLQIILILIDLSLRLRKNLLRRREL